MSLHSYSNIWLHLIWGILNHEKKLLNREFRKEISRYLYTYSKEKLIFMKTNYVNSDHVHVIIDLPVNLSIQDLMQLIKGSTSHWINKHPKQNNKFSWGRGYGVFSVSQSNLNKVSNYINTQEEHHSKKSFKQEYDEFIKKHNLLLKVSD